MACEVRGERQVDGAAGDRCPIVISGVRDIRNGRRHIARVDFIYDAHRLVVEVTGRKGHVSDAERTRDAQRRNELQDLGYRVIEYTSADVRDRPAYVVDSLRTRLTPRSCDP